ncbi:hypothetical protein [Burkholderia ubonensis]|uniref:hypothetical protein n=1 Tax=Burkholderia ubonensis TaxID=101571 RepID=UPI00075DD765|nr:hypothetical protein [Burkholderia ubonensis]KWN75051.1 hypothetical protein WM23_26885 [Burkholderia ubonensis]OJA27776.1 hypothetical protein BGX87_20625 [Burkholderia ubonensis]
MSTTIKTYTVERDGKAHSKVYKRPHAAVAYVNRRWHEDIRDSLKVIERVYEMQSEGEYVPKTKGR